MSKNPSFAKANITVVKMPVDQVARYHSRKQHLATAWNGTRGTSWGERLDPWPGTYKSSLDVIAPLGGKDARNPWAS